jgi:hypothetical protein
VSLAMALGGVVVSRRDPKTGSLIPFHAPKQQAANASTIENRTAA